MKIVFENVKKDFKKINILHDVNVTFESGKIYGLIGTNGSGKSVFLKMLCGFYKPTEGTILFDGINYIENKSFPPNLRALIESPCFLPDLTGFENLKLLASIQNKIGENEINQTLEKVNLLKDKDKKYNTYSLGMKQKLGLAQVLMEDPEIIILDEPFNGIEEKTAEKLRTLLLEEKAKNKLIIIATHLKEDIATLTDEIYLFDDGNLSNK